MVPRQQPAPDNAGTVPSPPADYPALTNLQLWLARVRGFVGFLGYPGATHTKLQTGIKPGQRIEGHAWDGWLSELRADDLEGDLVEILKAPQFAGTQAIIVELATNLITWTSWSGAVAAPTGPGLDRG